MFDGDIQVRAHGRGGVGDGGEDDGRSSSRGTGVLDMARAIREDRPHRATGALAYHVLDVMVSIAESGRRGEFVQVESTVEPAPLLPTDWDPKAATV